MKNDDAYVDEDETAGVFVRPRERELPPPPPRSDHQLWDANDVARYLKVSRSWVYHRAEAGLLPLRRVGGLLRFDPAAIRAFAVGDPDHSGLASRPGVPGRRSRR